MSKIFRGPCNAWFNLRCGQCDGDIKEGDNFYFYEEEKICEACKERLEEERVYEKAT